MTADELATFGAAQPTARVSLRQVARQSVDSRSRRGPVVVLRRGGRTPWSTPRPLGLPVGRIGVELGACRSPRDALLHRWPAMELLGQAASKHIGPTRSPSATTPRCTRASRSRCGCSSASSVCRSTATPTITGGMAFAGGPFNSFVLQATAAMARRLREQRRSRPRDDGQRPARPSRAWRCGRANRAISPRWSPISAPRPRRSPKPSTARVGYDGPRHDRGLDGHLRRSRPEERDRGDRHARRPTVDRRAATTPSSSRAATRSALVGVPVEVAESRLRTELGRQDDLGEPALQIATLGVAADQGERVVVGALRLSAPAQATEQIGTGRRPRGDSRPAHPRPRSRRRVAGRPRAHRPWPPPPLG